MLVAAIVAACGGSDEPSGDDNSSSSPTATPTGSTDNTSAASATSGTDSSDTRTVVDAIGNEVTIPVDPQRIVAINDLTAGVLLSSVGVELTGMCTRSGEIRPEFVERWNLQDVAGVGECYEPDIEALVELEPDIIVAEAFQGEILLDPAVIEQLEAIAPVYTIDVFSQPIEQYMSAVGEAFGVQDVVAEQAAEYDEAVAALSDELGDASELSISRLDLDPGATEIGLLGRNNVVQVIAAELGMPESPLVAEASTDENGGYLFIPFERLPEVDADVIFIVAFDGADPTTIPGWRTLRAVQADQAIIVPDQQATNELYGFDYLTFNNWIDYVAPILTSADQSVT